MKSLRLTSMALMLATAGILALSGCRLEGDMDSSDSVQVTGVDVELAATGNQITFFGPPPSVDDAVLIGATASSITPSGFVAATDDQNVLVVTKQRDGTYTAQAAQAAGLITSRDLGGLLLLCSTDPDFKGWPTLAVSTPGWTVSPVEGTDPAINGQQFDANFGCGSNDTTQDVTMDGTAPAFAPEGVTEGNQFATARAYKLTRGQQVRYMVIGTVSVTVDGVQQEKLMEIYLPSAPAASQ